jgi:hypothetical protein
LEKLNIKVNARCDGRVDICRIGRKRETTNIKKTNPKKQIQIPKNKSQNTKNKLQKPDTKDQIPYMNFGETGEGLKRKPAVSSALVIVI